MKKLLLLSSLVAFMSTIACDGITPNTPDGPENPDVPGANGYVLSKVKAIIEGEAYDFINLQYSSLNPVVVSEFVGFDIYQDLDIYEPNPNKSPMRMTKKAKIDGKTVIKDIVTANGKMTAKVVMVSDGESDEIGALDIVLDNLGRAIDVKLTFNDFTSLMKLEYNAEGYLSKASERDSERDKDDLVTTITYIDGNISKCSVMERYMTSDSGNAEVEKEETHEVVYSGYDTQNNGGTPHTLYLNSDEAFSPFYHLGILGKISAKLPSKSVYDNRFETTYTYEKDANGNVSKMKIVSNDDGKVSTSEALFEYIKTDKK